VNLPDGTHFIPQRPYLPIGRLRDALAYPEPATRFNDDQMCQALVDALLPALAHRLDEHAAWDQQLSGGEQQRLALARIFLRRPRWVFADEATSALDEASEKTLYTCLRERVEAAGGALVSIAHRPAVAAFHARAWTFEPVAAEGPAVSGAARYRVREEAVSR
jgi:vitamin B12/bleomycin/antimicrobial peptide transport system ATP-binding/permease protein